MEKIIAAILSGCYMERVKAFSVTVDGILFSAEGHSRMDAITMAARLSRDFTGHGLRREVKVVEIETTKIIMITDDDVSKKTKCV